MKAFPDRFGHLEYEVIVEVHNEGDAAAGLEVGANGYTIDDKGGAVLVTGNLTYAFPEILAPDAYGYYIDGGPFALSTTAKDVGAFAPTAIFDTTTCDPGAIVVSDVRVEHVVFGMGLSANGTVTNNGTKDATDLIVGYVFFNARRDIIGGVYDNLTGALPAGQSIDEMAQLPDTPPLQPADVKTTLGFAYDSQLGC